jgi:hypothetical protein
MRLPVLIPQRAIVAAFCTVAFAAAVLGQQTTARSGAANSAKTWKAPRTVDGQPDLQGIWTNATITSLERPAELAGKAVFTAVEAAEYEKVVAVRNDVDQRPADRQTDVALGYNGAWWDRGTRVVKTLRTSLIVDPPDGRIPALTPEAQKRVAARAEANRQKCATSYCTPGANPVPATGPEDRSLAERCIVWPVSGPPMLPAGYNNTYQIIQTEGHVAILVEMIHDVRIIPLDHAPFDHAPLDRPGQQRPHLPSNVRTWLGNSHGHWEGDTLVVETTGFRNERNFRNATGNMRILERFTRMDPETLMYKFTVEDPETFTRPWTAELPMTATPGPLFEYACHEGNYGMEGILGGARKSEQK